MRTLLLTFVLTFNVVAFAAGSPELLVAIRNGDHARVQKLLDSGADPNTADADGTTALMHAVVESDVKMMTFLVGKGASVNTKNALDSTALLYAATNLAKTRVLLDAGADVKVTGRRGATPMSVAVTAPGSTPVLKLLTARGAAPEDRLMTLAAGNGDLEAIQFLLSIGVPAGEAGGATVSAAIGARCEACARLLVERGAPVNGLRANGAGVLNDTAKRAMPEFSQYLLDHGASLASKDREGFTLLMQAVFSMEVPAARDRMVQWLLSKGVDPDAKNERGDTAFLLAARMGIPSTMDLLAKAGARQVHEERPKASGGAASAETAVRKILPLMETGGEPVFKSMQLNALADADASVGERAPFVRALKANQKSDGSWSQLPGIPGEAYATGEALYALHVSGKAPITDPVYQKGVQWLLRNQLPDGTWFTPTLAVPVQPHTFESFPHGWHQFASQAGSSWAALSLLYTLPDK